MKKVLYVAYSIIIILLLTEFALRLTGIKPVGNDTSASKILSKPGPLFSFDSIYGYSYTPGNFMITLNNQLNYHAQINIDKTRNNPFNDDTSKREIAVFGCSFFAGMGVEDSSVVSAQLKKIIPEYNVFNYSIPGHGMTTEYIKIKELISDSEPPDIALFSIASFHLHRNPGLYSFTKNFSSIKNSPVNFIYAYNKDEQIKFDVKNIRESTLPLSSYSSLAFQLNLLVEKMCFTEKDLIKMENQLIDSVIAVCNLNNIVPILFFITNDDLSQELIMNARKNGYRMIISEVDYNNEKYNLMPVDGHPNGFAHYSYAKEIYDYLSNNDLINRYSGQ